MRSTQVFDVCVGVLIRAGTEAEAANGDVYWLSRDTWILKGNAFGGGNPPSAVVGLTGSLGSPLFWVLSGPAVWL